jgi:hypothetical protein
VGTLLEKVIYVNVILRSLDLRCAECFFLRRLTPVPPELTNAPPPGSHAARSMLPTEASVRTAVRIADYTFHAWRRHFER